MTCIVYRDGVLAADSMTSLGDTISDLEALKIFEIGDGSFAAGAGPRALIVRYMEWLKHPTGERPSLQRNDDKKQECDVLVVHSDGSLELHEHEGIEDLGKREFYALGTGDVAARAALLMGADAVTAVEVASVCDVWTGGRVSFVKIDQIVPTEAPVEEQPQSSAPDWRYRYNLKSGR